MSKKTPPITRTDGLCGKAERRVITGIPDSTWDELEQAGLAPTRTRIGRRCFWSRRELLEWCEQRLAERLETWVRVGDAAGRVIDKVRP